MSKQILMQNKELFLPKEVSCFTFPGVVLLPRGKLPLAVVEPHHIQMIEAALKIDRLLGVVQLVNKNGSETDKKYYNSGCLGKICAFHESEENGYFIVLSGLRRFSIVKEVSQGGQDKIHTFEVSYETYPFDLIEENSLEEDRPKLMHLLKEYFSAHNLVPNWAEIESTSDERLITSLTMLCPFLPQEKQALLETQTLKERYKILSAIMELSFNERMGNNVKH